MIDITRTEVLENKRYWLNKYESYKKILNDCNAQKAKYQNVRDRIQLSIDNANELQNDTKNLITVISAGAILSENKGLGEKELTKQGENMAQVVKGLAPILKKCDTELSDLDSKISDAERQSKIAWYNYLDCCTRLSNYNSEVYFVEKE